MFFELDGVSPTVVDETVWVAPTASVIGRVELAHQSSVWFGATIRGDNDPVFIGQGSNIQDNSVLHTDEGAPLRIGDRVTVGHKVMLHGCEIGNNSLIGMGSTILDYAKVGAGSIVGANSLVTQGKEFPERVLIMGSPAKVVRELTDEEYEMISKSADIYIENAQRFKKSLKKINL